MGGFDLSPSSYWGMTPSEVFSYYEVKRPKHIGNLHEDDIDRMLQRREELEAQGIQVI